MRRAGLLTYVNRTNRQPVPGQGMHKGEKRSDHQRSATVKRPWVGRAPRAPLPALSGIPHRHEQQQMETSAPGCGTRGNGLGLP
jgi:hypothetical protein